jgi:hypothetical protein
MMWWCSRSSSIPNFKLTADQQRREPTCQAADPVELVPLLNRKYGQWLTRWGGAKTNECSRILDRFNFIRGHYTFTSPGAGAWSYSNRYQDWASINFHSSYYNSTFNFVFFHELAHHYWWYLYGPYANENDANAAEIYAQEYSYVCASG